MLEKLVRNIEVEWRRQGSATRHRDNALPFTFLKRMDGLRFGYPNNPGNPIILGYRLGPGPTMLKSSDPTGVREQTTDTFEKPYRDEGP